MSYRDAIRAAMSSPPMEDDERAERSEVSVERYRNSPQYAADVKTGRAAECKRLRAAVLSPRIAGNADAMRRVVAFAAEMPDASPDDLVAASLSGRVPKVPLAASGSPATGGLRVDIVANARARQSRADNSGALQSNMKALLASDQGKPDGRSPGLLAMAVERYGPKDGATGDADEGTSRLAAMARQRYGPKDHAE